MLSETNNDFRILFLLKFTSELIRHSKGEVFELETALKGEEEKLKSKTEKASKKSEELMEADFEKLSNITADKIEPESNVSKPFFNISVPPLPRKRQRLIKRPFLSPLRIPEPKLPPRLQYLRPIPTNVNIDLGKLNILVKDPLVRIIQCNGAGENIIVQGGMGTKTTGIILSKEEVDDLIKKFSEISKIPADEGVVRIVIGRLILVAVISDIVNTKFIIKKMMRGLPMPLKRI